MADWKYHRDADGSIIHGPQCMPPTKGFPRWICEDCDYVDPHGFIPHRPPHEARCHECGLAADDPVHGEHDAR